MFALGIDLFFSPFPALPVLAVSHRKTRRICQVEIYLQNSSSLDSPTYKEVICYNSWCCKHGCCAWYINLSVVIFIMLVFFLTLKLIDKCWHKYCRHISETSTTNESQENMLMMSANQSICTSRDVLPNYGSNSSNVPSLQPPKEDRPPTYEEAMATSMN